MNREGSAKSLTAPSSLPSLRHAIPPPPPHRPPSSSSLQTPSRDGRGGPGAAERHHAPYKDIISENTRLRAALQQMESDSVQVAQFFEDKLAEVQREATAYKEGMTQLLDDHRHAEETLQARYGELLQERDTELSRYATLTSKLHEDLQQASHHVQQRQEHAVELQELRQQLVHLAAAHEKEVAALHFQTVDRKLKLLALEKTMRAEFASLVEAQATKVLEDRFQRVLDRTRTLEDEKAALTHDMSRLMALTSEIETERVQVRRQAEVQQAAQKQLTHHVWMRGRQKEQADVKAYQLEERVRELTLRQKTSVAEVEARYQGRIAALEEELQRTQNSLKAHRTELQQMRQLTAQVVGQRSELENFFHTALADCQRYCHTMSGSTATRLHGGTTAKSNTATRDGGPKAALSPEKLEWGCMDRSSHSTTNSTRAAAAAATAADGTAVARASSPSATSVGDSAAAAALQNRGMFFEELEWKDKEKVIKSLLFFLNANYYKTAVSDGEAVA